MRRPRVGLGDGRDETPREPGLDPRGGRGERSARPGAGRLGRRGLAPPRGRDGVSACQDPAALDGNRPRGGRRSVFLQGAPASGSDRAREERRSREAGPPRRLRGGRFPARERVRRIPRMRERVRGDRVAPRRRSGAPSARRRGDPSGRRSPGGRRPILAVRPQRNGRRRGPGGGSVRKVGVVGAGMTLFRRRLEETGKEMCFEATKMALDSAGLTRADVDTVVCGTAPDAFDGVAMRGEHLLDGCGGYRKPYTRVFTGGGTGVFSTIAGWWHVASGLAEVALVVNEEKMSSCQPHPQSVFAHIWDPILDRPLKPNLVWIFAMEMNRYMTVYGVKKEDIARVAVKNKRNAVGHPCAQLPDANITLEDVMNSELMAWPVRRLDISPPSDGAAAIVLASEDVVRKRRLRDQAAWIKGVGWCIDSTMWTDRDLVFPEYVNRAAKMAYRP